MFLPFIVLIRLTHPGLFKEFWVNYGFVIKWSEIFFLSSRP